MWIIEIMLFSQSLMTKNFLKKWQNFALIHRDEATIVVTIKDREFCNNGSRLKALTITEKLSILR